MLFASVLAMSSMSGLTNERWTLARRPDSAAGFHASDLQMESEQIDEASLEDGQVLVAVETLSIEVHMLRRTRRACKQFRT